MTNEQQQPNAIEGIDGTSALTAGLGVWRPIANAPDSVTSFVCCVDDQFIALGYVWIPPHKDDPVRHYAKIGGEYRVVTGLTHWFEPPEPIKTPNV